MATTVVRYVNTDSTPGGDGTTNNTTGATRAYASRSEWEAAEQKDLVTADEVHEVRVNGSANDGNTTISGWTTDATRFVRMVMVAGTEHDGTPDSGDAQVVMNSSWVDGFDILQAYTVLEDQVVKQSAANAAGFYSSTAAGKVFRRCIAKITGTTRSPFYNLHVDRLENCLALTSSASYTGRLFARNSWSATEFVNCIAASQGSNAIGFGGGPNPGARLLINCVAFDCATSYESSTNAAACKYNAASDASTNTPPGTNPITTDIVAADFADEANEDYHIAASGSTLEDAGVGPSTESEVPDHDIDNDSRSGTTTGLGIDTGPTSTTHEESYAGSVTVSGAIALQVGKDLAGSSTASADVLKSIERELAGSSSASGDVAVSRTLLEEYSGSVGISGAIARLVGKLLGGSSTASGDVTRETSTSAAGAVSASGDVTRQTEHALSGSIGASGDVSPVKTILRALAGSLTASGALSRLVARLIGGSSAVSGDVTKSTERELAGSSTPEGVVSSTKTLLVSLAGSSTVAGALVRLVGKLLGGASTVSGDVAKSTERELAGSSTPAGALSSTRTAIEVLEGSSSAAGSVSHQVGKGVAGSSSAAGELWLRVGRSFSASSVVAGVVGTLKVVTRALVGAVTGSGDLVVLKLDAGEPQYLELAGPVVQYVELDGEVVEAVDLGGPVVQYLDVGSFDTEG